MSDIAQDSDANVKSPFQRLIQAKQQLENDAEFKRSALSAGSAFIIRAGGAAILYLAQILIARMLGEENYGIYVLVWTCVLMIGGMASLGMTISISRFVPEYREASDPGHLKGVIFFARWFPVLLATGWAVLLAGIVWLAGDWIASPYVIPLFIGLLCLPSFAGSDAIHGVMLAHERVIHALWPLYILRPLVLLIVMAVFFWSGAEPSGEKAMLAAVVATWFTFILQQAQIHWLLPKSAPSTARAMKPKKWLIVSAPILLVESAYFFMSNTDILMLGLLASPTDVALYFAAVKTLALVAMVHFAIAAVTMPRFSDLYVRKDMEGFTKLFRQSVALTFWPSLGGAVVVIVFGEFILSLFGDNFVDAYSVMFIFAVGLLARAAAGPSERILNVVGQERTCAKIYMVAFIVNIIANAALIPFFGIQGAAMATSAAYILESILLVRAVRSSLGVTVINWDRQTRKTAHSVT